MKVLLINTTHTRGGGANTVYLNTADMLRRAGIGVIHFARHSSKEIPCDQSSYFAKKMSQGNPLDYINRRFYNHDAAHCLQKLIDAEHPDIAQAHLIWEGLAPSILDVLRRNNIPIIHTVHDYAMVCSMVTLRGRDGKVCERCRNGHFCQSVKTKCHHGSLVRSFIASAEIKSRNLKHHPVSLIDHFMFVSKFCADKHSEMDERFKGASQSVLYNVPDEDVVKLAANSLPNTFSNYYLYYGRLSYEKGLGTLIDAFLERPELQLKIVGTGPLETEMKKKCQIQEAKNIEFLGFKSGEELYRIVQNAKFVCVPSEWYENNPMTIIEAYTLGTPVLAARIGGIPEIVNDGETGFLFESGHKEELLLTLQKSETMVVDDYLNMKKNAIKFSNVKFERDKYVEKLTEMFYQVIRNKNSH